MIVFFYSQTASTSDTAGVTSDITTEDNLPQSTKMGKLNTLVIKQLWKRKWEEYVHITRFTDAE